MAERPILIIGGGPAGMEAARGVAEVGYRAVLVEQRDELGGTPVFAHYAALTPDFADAGEATSDLAAAAGARALEAAGCLPDEIDLVIATDCSRMLPDAVACCLLYPVRTIVTRAVLLNPLSPAVLLLLPCP